MKIIRCGNCTLECGWVLVIESDFFRGLCVYMFFLFNDVKFFVHYSCLSTYAKN